MEFYGGLDERFYEKRGVRCSFFTFLWFRFPFDKGRNDLINPLIEVFWRELGGGSGDFCAVEVGFFELTEGFYERFWGLSGKEKAVHAVNDKILATAFAIGNNWTASSESLNGGNTERLEAGENVALRAL